MSCVRYFHEACSEYWSINHLRTIVKDNIMPLCYGIAFVVLHVRACVHTLHVLMKMGGKNAAIVFPDCDRAKCLRTLLRACFLNQGEICLCTSRVFVHESIYKEFLADFVEETKQVPIDISICLNVPYLIYTMYKPFARWLYLLACFTMRKK